MSGFQILCANKNTNGTIVRIGGSGWSLTTHEAIIQLVTKRLRLNIVIAGVQHDVGVRGEGIDAFLVLEADGKPLHDLETLPSC